MRMEVITALYPTQIAAGLFRHQHDVATEKGAFMWHDYLGDAWNVRITGGGIASKFAYRGQVTAERPCFSAPVA